MHFLPPQGFPLPSGEGVRGRGYFLTAAITPSICASPIMRPWNE